MSEDTRGVAIDIEARAVQPRRVLHCIGRLIPGGVELRTLELVQELRDSGVEHYVCVLSGELGTLDNAYSEAGVRLIYCPIRKITFPIRFVRHLRNEQIQAVHSNIHYSSGLILMLAWAAGVPRRIVHFQSDGVPKHARPMCKRFQDSVQKLLIWVFATDVAALTPQSLDLAWSPRWRRDARCSVVTNGVRVPLQKAPVPGALADFPETDALILHVGRGELATKRRDFAVRVFSELALLRPNSVLAFVGRDGATKELAHENRVQLKRLASELGVENRVRFFGETLNVSGFLQRGDALLFTSSLEGLPGVILEALAEGLPVVSSEIPGTAFINQHVALDAVLPVDGSPEEWAAALVRLPARLSAEERLERSQRVRESAFDISVAAAGYSRLWEPVAGRRRFVSRWRRRGGGHGN